eukprot:COSAG02_NODE_353_length_24023_cov_77.872304_1_plen_320_part_00
MGGSWRVARWTRVGRSAEEGNRLGLQQMSGEEPKDAAKAASPTPSPAPGPADTTSPSTAEPEVVELTVKSTAGTAFKTEVPADSTVLAVKEAIADQSKIPAQNQRLVFKGQVLKDEKTLVGDYGFKSGGAVHVVRGVAPASPAPAPAPAPAATPAPAQATPGLGLGGLGLGGLGLGGLGLGGLGGMPPGGMDLNAMQRQMQEQMAANPGMMEQMLNSPAMQSLMQNPEAISGMIQSNPQMRALMEQNPELRSMLSDPNLMRQSLEAARNPALRAELTRNTDRAMANIEGMPGGYNALAHMYQTGECCRYALRFWECDYD